MHVFSVHMARIFFPKRAGFLGANEKILSVIFRQDFGPIFYIMEPFSRRIPAKIWNIFLLTLAR